MKPRKQHDVSQKIYTRPRLLKPQLLWWLSMG